MVYDASLNAWLKFGNDLSSGICKWNPPEICVQLCAELGMHPYFVTPYLTIDPPTDYMSSLASYCRDNAPAWMVPRFEGCNETWNFAGGFFATRYGWNKAFNSWRTQYDHNNWYGKTVSILGSGDQQGLFQRPDQISGSLWRPVGIGAYSRFCQHKRFEADSPPGL